MLFLLHPLLHFPESIFVYDNRMGILYMDTLILRHKDTFPAPKRTRERHRILTCLSVTLLIPFTVRIFRTR